MSHGSLHRDVSDFLTSGDDAAAAIARGLATIPAARLAVHRNTFIATLADMLAETFPVTQALVGEDFFRAMARSFVLAVPVRTANLVDYALDFPAFVAGYAPVAAMPFVHELAQLEAMRLRAFHAADVDAVEPAAFQPLALDARRLAHARVRLHPAAQWLRARHAVHALWSAHHEASDMRAIDLAGLDLQVPQDVLVSRFGYALQVLALPPGAADFLDALAGGSTLAQAFAGAVAGDARTDPAALFTLLLRHGLATELHDTFPAPPQDDPWTP